MSHISSSHRPADQSHRDYNFAVRLTSVTLLCTLLICYHAFIPSGRVIYSPAPLVGALTYLPASCNTALFVVELCLLAWLLFRPAHRPALLGVIALHIFWILQDVARMQPFFYMFCYTFLMAAIFRDSKKIALDAIKIMICGVYFWAGFHKINLLFYGSVFPWFVSPLYDFTNKSIPEFITLAATVTLLATPFLEAAIGILLLFPSTRKYGCMIAYSMLVVVLMCLGPLGHNWAMAVWPWNIWIFIMEYQLICSPQNRDLPPVLSGMKKSGYITFILFFIMPMLAFWSTWYTYPGFKLYSGNTLSARVESPPEETYTHVPVFLRKALREKHSLNVWEWGKYEQGFRYPTVFSYTLGAAGLCQYLDYPSKATLVIMYSPPFYRTKMTEETLPLCQ